MSGLKRYLVPQYLYRWSTGSNFQWLPEGANKLEEFALRYMSKKIQVRGFTTANLLVT